MNFLSTPTLFIGVVCLLNVIDTQQIKEKVFLLIFDGFVHNFEKLTTNMPNFQKLASEGIRAKGLIPPFPPGMF